MHNYRNTPALLVSTAENPQLWAEISVRGRVNMNHRQTYLLWPKGYGKLGPIAKFVWEMSGVLPGHEALDHTESGHVGQTSIEIHHLCAVLVRLAPFHIGRKGTQKKHHNPFLHMGASPI